MKRYEIRRSDRGIDFAWSFGVWDNKKGEWKISPELSDREAMMCEKAFNSEEVLLKINNYLKFHLDNVYIEHPNSFEMTVYRTITEGC